MFASVGGLTFFFFVLTFNIGSLFCTFDNLIMVHFGEVILWARLFDSLNTPCVCMSHFFSRVREFSAMVSLNPLYI